MMRSFLLCFAAVPCLLLSAVTVAVSQNAHLLRPWLQSIDPEIEVIDLGSIWEGNREKILLQCAGLILSDGPDVHPTWYTRHAIPSPSGVDEERDRQELGLTQIAFEEDLPILAIGRGLQLLNVFCGGTLIMNDLAETPQYCTTIETLAATLTPISYSDNGIVEAFEWKEPGAPFLLAMRWSPEYASTSPLSQRIATAFCVAARQHQK